MFKTLKKILQNRRNKKMSKFDQEINKRRVMTVPNLYIRTIDGDKLIKININDLTAINRDSDD